MSDGTCRENPHRKSCLIFRNGHGGKRIRVNIKRIDAVTTRQRGLCDVDRKSRRHQTGSVTGLRATQRAVGEPCRAVGSGVRPI